MAPLEMFVFPEAVVTKQTKNQKTGVRCITKGLQRNDSEATDRHAINWA